MLLGVRPVKWWRSCWMCHDVHNRGREDILQGFCAELWKHICCLNMVSIRYVAYQSSSMASPETDVLGNLLQVLYVQWQQKGPCAWAHASADYSICLPPRLRAEKKKKTSFQPAWSDVRPLIRVNRLQCFMPASKFGNLQQIKLPHGLLHRLHRNQ